MEIIPQHFLTACKRLDDEWMQGKRAQPVDFCWGQPAHSCGFQEPKPHLEKKYDVGRDSYSSH